MSLIDDIFRKRFKNLELKNDGFDDDALWNSISSELNTKPKRTPYWMLTALAVLFLGSISTLYLYNLRTTSTYIPRTNSAVVFEDAVENPSKVEHEISLQTHRNETSTRESSSDQLSKESHSKEGSSNAPADTGTVSGHSKVASQNESPGDRENETVLSHREQIESETEITEPIHEVDGLALSAVQSMGASPSELQQDSAEEEAPRTYSAADDLKSQAIEHASDGDNQSKDSRDMALHQNADEGALPKTTSTEVSPVEDTVEASGTELIEEAEESGIAVTAEADGTTSIDSLHVETDAEVADIAAAEYTAPKVEKLWRLEAFGGMNHSMISYSAGNEEAVNIKNDSEKGQIGSSFGLGITRYLNAHFTVSSGIEYRKLWNKFEYTKETTYQTALDSVVVFIVVDPDTGEELEYLYGDTTVNATRTRDVVHHSSHNIFSIPLTVGYSTKINNLILGLNIGAVFSFTSGQQGKFLNPDLEIVEYKSNDTYSPLSPSNVSLRIAPEIGYQLTDWASVHLRPIYNWQRSKVFEGDGWKLNYNYIDVVVGVGVKF